MWEFLLNIPKYMVQFLRFLLNLPRYMLNSAEVLLFISRCALHPDYVLVGNDNDAVKRNGNTEFDRDVRQYGSKEARRRLRERTEAKRAENAKQITEKSPAKVEVQMHHESEVKQCGVEGASRSSKRRIKDKRSRGAEEKTKNDLAQVMTRKQNKRQEYLPMGGLNL